MAADQPGPPLRVAIVCDWFLRYASEQAVGLKTAGAEVLVVCRDHLQEFDNRGAEWRDRIDAMSDAGVQTRIIRGRTSSLSAMLTGLGAVRLIRTWRPDVIHAHPSVDPWLHLATLGFPLLLTIHDPVPHPGQPMHGRIGTALSDAWRTRADAFIVHGEALVEPSRPTATGRPIRVIPHGLVPTSEPYPPPARRRIVQFGRLTPYKGLSVLVEAVEQVWKQRSDVDLMIAGDGPSADEIPSHPQIHLRRGYYSDAELDEMLASATLVTAAYTEASQSGVVSVALGHGVPTIVSDVGALPDLAVEPGLMVPAGDADALARTLLAYLDHGQDLREHVHAFAQNRLSWEAVGRRALEVYPEFVRRRA